MLDQEKKLSLELESQINPSIKLAESKGLEEIG